MGADSRIRDLVNELNDAEVQTLINTLTLIMDDPSFGLGDSNKILLKTLLSSTLVAEASTLEHLALTPKGFAASLSAETRAGIVKYANNTDIENRAGNGVLRAGKIAELINNIFASSFIINTGNKNNYLYLDGSNVDVGSVDLRVRQLGGITMINGTLQIITAGAYVSANVVFKNVPMITFLQSISCSLNDGSPAGCVVNLYDGTKIIFKFKRATAWNGYHTIAIGGFYATL